MWSPAVTIGHPDVASKTITGRVPAAQPAGLNTFEVNIRSPLVSD
jgi:hypothetical protein